jgi:hypothetical protein
MANSVDVRRLYESDRSDAVRKAWISRKANLNKNPLGHIEDNLAEKRLSRIPSSSHPAGDPHHDAHDASNRAAEKSIDAVDSGKREHHEEAVRANKKAHELHLAAARNYAEEGDHDTAEHHREMADRHQATYRAHQMVLRRKFQ